MWQRATLLPLAARSVLGVEEGRLRVQQRGHREETLEFGTCVWATGVGMHPLVSPCCGRCCIHSLCVWSRGDSGS